MSEETTLTENIIHFARRPQHKKAPYALKLPAPGWNTLVLSDVLNLETYNMECLQKLLFLSPFHSKPNEGGVHLI